MGNNEYKRRHKELGLCLNCSDKAMPGFRFCLKHFKSRHESDVIYEYKNKKDRVEKKYKNKESRKDSGRCKGCSTPLSDEDKGYLNCMNCRQGKFFSNKRRKAALIEQFQNRPTA